MTFKLPLIFSLMLACTTAIANDQIINSDVEKALQNSNAEMMKSVNKMNKTFEKIMPEITQSMSQSMSQILNSITPVMEALEKNQSFSKASEQFSKEVANSVNELNLPNTRVDTSDDYLSIKGGNTVDDNSLQFSVNQNPNLVTNTAEFIKMLKAGGQLPNLSVLTLNNSIVPLKDFQVIEIDGNAYLFFDGKTKSQDFSFITGIIANDLNLQVQTSGPDHGSKSLEFIRSLRSHHIAELSPQSLPKTNTKIRLFPKKH